MSCLSSNFLKIGRFSEPSINNFRKYSLKTGNSYSEKRILTEKLVKDFTAISGDTNPVHTSSVFIESSNKFSKPLVHGALLNSLVSSVIGTKLPGPGCLVVKQELNFPSPCYIGEEITIEVTLKDFRKISTVNFICKTSDEVVVLHGYAKVVQISTKVNI